MSETVKDFGRGCRHTSWMLECHGRSDRGHENAQKIGHRQKREREWAAVAWLSPGLGWGIYTASLRRGVTVYATQRRSEWGKRKKKD